MALSYINQWLEGGRLFQEGVELLKEHGKPSKALLDLLSRGETAYAKDRLAEALGKVLESAVSSPAAAPKPAPRLHPGMVAAALVNGADHADWPDSRYPVELQELKGEIRAWLREQDTLFGGLRYIPTKDKRYETALRIKELDDLVHAAYYRLDTFRSTGTDLGMITERPKTAAELLIERNNLRSYICRAQKGTRKASAEQLAAWKARLSIINTMHNARQEG